MSPGHRHGSAECREIFAQLSEYLDGELDASGCAQMDGHMGDCPPCQAFLESLRRTIALVESLESPSIPEDLRRRLHAAYRELGETPLD